jgi:hypothetical protein
MPVYPLALAWRGWAALIAAAAAVALAFYVWQLRARLDVAHGRIAVLEISVQQYAGVISEQAAAVERWIAATETAVTEGQERAAAARAAAATYREQAEALRAPVAPPERSAAAAVVEIRKGLRP